MRACLFAFAVSCVFALQARPEDKKPAPEPKVTSVDPVSGSVGKTYTAVVRGRNLKGAQGLDITGEGVRGRVLRVDSDVYIEISSDPKARPGPRSIRLLTPEGVTNEATIWLASEPVLGEADVPNPIIALPLVVAGRISERGQVDAFWFEAAAGQTVTFQAKAGNNSLDPSLAILQRAPTWLDPNHMEQIAFNDEPLFFPGLSTDAYLVHKFAKAGRYCLKVESSNGQGSADAVYELRVSEGALPPPVLHPKPKGNGWDERLFTRELSENRQKNLARRGAVTEKLDSIESYRASLVGSNQQLPVMRLPGVIEGRITHPAEAHRIKLRIEKSENIAIEVETPDATMPRFNPVILLFEPGGGEVATNVYTKRNNNGLYMMKMIHPKVTVSLHAPGDYEMEIRDITTDRSGDDFRYRVLVRRQIPHIGNIDVAEDQINLRPGVTREVNITVDREEGFNGLVAFAAEGVPPGVTVMAAAPKPVDKPPLPNGGKLERYTPTVQNSALIFMASPDAAPTSSVSKVRIVARPVVKGKLGDVIVVKELPLVIVPENVT